MPRGSSPSRPLRIALLAIGSFNLVSALVGMVGLTLGGGMGLPLAWLDRTGFDSYVWPGLFLGVVVGGVQALAIGAQYRRLEVAWGLHAAAGLVMLGWIFVELALVLTWAPLQGVYFVTGTVQVVLAVLALGAWPRPFLSREERPSAGSRRRP